MSRAFVKESAESAPPPERMIADGPNPVTPEGLVRIEAEVSRIEAALKSESNVLLRETLERDLRYWAVKKARAVVVIRSLRPALPGSSPVSTAEDKETVAFGSTVTIERRAAGAPRRQTFRIVGEDEAEPAKGTISWRSPLAAVLLGARAGDIVEMETPKAQIEIVAVA